jgi:hypothetical protein
VKELTIIFRKLGGATLLLALWLSLVPIIQASGAESPSLKVPASVSLTKLLASNDTVFTETAAAAQKKPDGTGGDTDDAPSVSLFGAPAPLLAPSGLHGLPAATGPPSSSTPHHYRARAPPVA